LTCAETGGRLIASALVAQPLSYDPVLAGLGREQGTRYRFSIGLGCKVKGAETCVSPCPPVAAFLPAPPVLAQDVVGFGVGRPTIATGEYLSDEYSRGGHSRDRKINGQAMGVRTLERRSW
jgi:hypothetical protein